MKIFPGFKKPNTLPDHYQLRSSINSLGEIKNIKSRILLLVLSMFAFMSVNGIKMHLIFIFFPENTMALESFKNLCHEMGTYLNSDGSFITEGEKVIC